MPDSAGRNLIHTLAYPEILLPKFYFQVRFQKISFLTVGFNGKIEACRFMFAIPTITTGIQWNSTKKQS